MNETTHICRNCNHEFIIESEDFLFYEKIKVPPPTWCPECRMIRRFVWRSVRNLFRNRDTITGKEVFSSFHKATPAKIYQLSYWNSDAWDPMDYSRDYDFLRPFFEQFRELMYAVPWSSKAEMNMINSDYSNQASDCKNCYLCFDLDNGENSAYVTRGQVAKECFDLYEFRHSELSYDSYMVDEAYRVFFSANVEDSTDVWFSRNLLGCSNCFGCVNLRNKSYHIFNKPIPKEEYKEFMKQFDSGSFTTISAMRKKAIAFWLQHPMRFTLAINVTNSTGEHIEYSKNLTQCYSVHEAENLKYCQVIDGATSDSYDYTVWGVGASQIYESLACGIEVANLYFCFDCWPSSQNLEYSMFCRSSSDLFACVGLKKKQYCIFNKQYSKEDYHALREKIIAHMNEMPYTDARGHVYKYGEFLPPEFSPFAYNETVAQDFFPLTKEQAEEKGYLWREPEKREYETTIRAADLPDHIKDVSDDIVKEIIECASCKRAYRIIPMELQFYRHISLPIPRLCPECRFQARFKFVNPPKLWKAKCQCNGNKSTVDGRQSTVSYANATAHFHGDVPCPNEFETSYAPGRPEIVYCEQCYQTEVV